MALALGLGFAATVHAQSAGGGGSAGSGGAAGGAVIQPLVVDYGVTARAEYVDNFGFNGRATWINSIGPSATLRMDSEVLKIAGSASLLGVHYSNDAAGRPNTTQPRFNLLSTYLRERSTIGLNVQYYRDRNLAGTQPLLTGGFQAVGGDRSVLSVGPTYSYALTERLSANANYGYSTITFAQNSPSQANSVGHTLGGGLQYRLNELDTVGVSVSESRFSTDPNVTESDSRSYQASWNRRWSEATTTALFVGIADTEVRGRSTQTVCLVPVQFCLAGLFPFQTITTGSVNSNRTPTYGLTWSTQFTQQTTAGAQLSRAIQPGAGGSLTEREFWSADVVHRFSERLSATVDYSRTRTAFAGTSLALSSAIQVLSLGMNYELGENWAFGAGARVSRTSVAVAEPISRAVFVTLSRTWPNNRLWP